MGSYTVEGIDKWPRVIESWDQHKIQASVRSNSWQRFRKYLKGLPTKVKLEMLRDYYDTGSDEDVIRCQVDNYLNALKRGGFLNEKLEVVK